ncbi:hypothetical protein MHYP_G00296660 [Metynnis hypsauchen]
MPPPAKLLVSAANLLPHLPRGPEGSLTDIRRSPAPRNSEVEPSGALITASALPRARAREIRRRSDIISTSEQHQVCTSVRNHSSHT